MPNTPIKQITEFNATPGAGEHLKLVYWDNDQKKFRYKTANDHTHDYDKYEYWTIGMPDSIVQAVRYGNLYNWYAVTDALNIAPAGWHVPTSAERDALGSYLGTAEGGGKLKETGITHWDSPNEGATNETGFGARGGGYRYFTNGVFSTINYNGIYFCSNAAGNDGYNFGLSAESAAINNSQANKKTGLSLRLIKDDSVDTGTMTGNDGRVYPTVKIGDQVWMAENSAETMYRDGSLIPVVTDGVEWAALVAGAMCAYDNDSTYALTPVSVEGDKIDIGSKEKLVLEVERGMEITVVDGKLLFSHNSFYTDNGIPYADTISALSKIVSKNRQVGMTINVNGTEYWFSGGILDEHLVVKPVTAHSQAISTITGLQAILDALALAISEWAGDFETKVDKVEGLGLSKNDFTDALLNKLNELYENNTGDQTLDGLQGVKRPATSTANGIAVFTDPSGTEIKSTEVTIDDRNQMSNSVNPDENGFSVADQSYAYGEHSYGKVGFADNIPILGGNLKKTTTGCRTGAAIRSDSAHITPPTEENPTGEGVAAPGFGLAWDTYIPVQGWVDPALSEVLGMRIVARLVNNSIGAESVDIEFWALRAGVLTLQGTLDHNGAFINTGGFYKSFSYIFTSSGTEIFGGMSIIDNPDMIDAEIVQIMRGPVVMTPVALGTPLTDPSTYTFDPSNGRTITTEMSLGETLAYIYQKVA
jgi:uncharacterized protein (TIGR02145 family)